MTGAEPTAGTSLGIGLVGTGGVAELHLAAARRAAGVHLVGVCDVDEGRARAAAGTGGVRWTTSIDELLAWPEIDAVILSTPNDTHAPLGRRILEANRHLLMEKPLALTLEDADALVSTAQSRDLVLAPGHTHRYYDYARAVRAAIADGAIGEPRYVRSSGNAGWLWPDWRSWVLDPARSGGHLVHNGVHGIDLLRWWLNDEPVAVRALGARVTSAYLDIPDFLRILVRFARGGVGVAEFSRAHRPKGFVERDLVAAGTTGTMAIRPPDWGAELQGETAVSPIGFDAAIGFVRQLEAFAEAIRGTAPLPVNADDARVALAVALAGERSLISGREEPVPADPRAPVTGR